jgi:hypothetical protein
MAVSEREDSCTVTWNPSSLTLDDLAKFTSLLVDLHNEVAVPYITEEFYQPGSNVVPPKSPVVASMSMGSPLITQLFAESSGILSLGMVGFILKSPDRLGEFLPRVSESWYEGKRRALEAKLQYVETRGRLNTRGGPVRRFEREYSRTRTREIRDRRRDDRPGRSR